MALAVFGFANTDEQVEYIVDELKRNGFESDEISVLLPDDRGRRDIAYESHTKAPEGAATGAGTGGLLGGALGLMAGVGALSIPGLGPFIAAGPIMAALSGAAVGAAVGGLSGALIGMGVPEIEAKHYEGKVRQGNILISVHTEDSVQRERAEEILEDAGAREVSYTAEARV